MGVEDFLTAVYLALRVWAVWAAAAAGRAWRWAASWWADPSDTPIALPRGVTAFVAGATPPPKAAGAGGRRVPHTLADHVQARARVADAWASGAAVNLEPWDPKYTVVVKLTRGGRTAFLRIVAGEEEGTFSFYCGPPGPGFWISHREGEPTAVKAFSSAEVVTPLLMRGGFLNLQMALGICPPPLPPAPSAPAPPPLQPDA